MDITETYIKMCDCEERQGQRYNHNDVGDVYVPPTFLVGNQSKPLIWLPRQDQLQEMVLTKQVEGDYTPVYKLNKAFYEYCYSPLTDSPKIYNASMEQLWLAFLMKELHGKVWAGEKWELSESLYGMKVNKTNTW